MLSIAALLLFSCQVTGYSNNYAEPDLASIREEFDRKLAATYYDILILKSHIFANDVFVEDAIGEEIDRLLTTEDANCRKQLSDLTEERCRMEASFGILSQIRAKFSQLREVACSTVEICQSLNPLMSQASDLEKCSLMKIADLRRQSVLVSNEFSFEKKKLFEDHDRCIRDLLNSALIKIAGTVYSCRKNQHLL